MSARDDYPDLAICAEESGYPIDDTEAIRALDEIDRLRGEVQRLEGLRT